jgi:preprotein translocase subunit YajC
LLAQASGAQQGNPLTMFGFLGVMVVIFYFFLIRPQSKQMKEHKAMLAALKKGDVVVTGGIIAKVHAVADKFIVLEVAPSVRLRVLASSITGKAPESLLEEEPKADAKAEKDSKDSK